VLGCWVAESESEASWGEVFAELKQRGLSGVRYVVSDDHAGMAYNLKRIVKVLGATGATQALAAA
jgi:transposase-like protein